MQRARVTGFKVAAALQTGEPFIGVDTAATELIAKTATAKPALITTLCMMSSLLGASDRCTSVGIARICLFGSDCAC
jgi:hypothetical protein